MKIKSHVIVSGSEFVLPIWNTETDAKKVAEIINKSMEDSE